MNRKGFTLIEMMIVVMIISGLMFLVVPNITRSKGTIDDETCNAYVTLVNSQIQAYKLDHDGVSPASLQDLVEGEYIKSVSCPNNTSLTLTGDTVTITTP